MGWLLMLVSVTRQLTSYHRPSRRVTVSSRRFGGKLGKRRKMSELLRQVVPHMSSELKLRAAFLVAVAILLVPQVLQVAAAQPFGWPGTCENCPYYSMKLVVTTLNTILLLILLAIYVSAYRETKSEFLVGLIIFDLAMLFYAVTSNPLVHVYFGFHEIGPGPFIMLPDFFSLVAVVVLLVQAFRYR
jgi:hypothetical protein